MKKPKFSELDYEAKKIVLQEVATRAELSWRINGNYKFRVDSVYYRYLTSLCDYISQTLPLLKLKDYFEYHYTTRRDNDQYIDSESINSLFNDVIHHLFGYASQRVLNMYISHEISGTEISISVLEKEVEIINDNNEVYQVLVDHFDEIKQCIIKELNSFSCVFDFLIKYIEIIDCKIYNVRVFKGTEEEK